MPETLPEEPLSEDQSSHLSLRRGSHSLKGPHWPLQTLETPHNCWLHRKLHLEVLLLAVPEFPIISTDVHYLQSLFPMLHRHSLMYLEPAHNLLVLHPRDSEYSVLRLRHPGISASFPRYILLR